MKPILPKAVVALSEILSTLPGIGPKSANRLTFYLLNQPDETISQFAEAFAKLRQDLVKCGRCHIVAEQDPCPICSSADRAQAELAVVEESLDVLALEKAGFLGRYHVLGGQISPINSVSPEDLTIAHLLRRLKQEPIKEVILATDPSLEGEATAIYIDEQITVGKKEGELPKNLSVTRLARGLPVGGDLEYADELTLSRALEGRRSYHQAK